MIVMDSGSAQRRHINQGSDLPGGLGAVESPTSDLDPTLLLKRNQWGCSGFDPAHFDTCVT